MAELDSLNKRGVTIVLVTHEPDVAEHARRMLMMKDGKIVSDKVIKKHRLSENAPKDTQNFKIEKQSPLPSLASVKENMRMALIALSLNKFRTFLTMLGMIVGVATVIAVTALGNGMAETTKARLASLGSNLAVIRPGNPNARGLGSAPRFMMQDADRIKQLTLAGGAVAKVDPTVQGGVLVSYGDNDWSTQLTGCEPAYAEMRNAVPIAGRFFTAQEDQQRDRVCLLGKTVIDNLYPAHFDPTGTQVEINKTNFTVIGVLPVKGANGFQDQDDSVVVPLQTAMWRVLGGGRRRREQRQLHRRGGQGQRQRPGRHRRGHQPLPHHPPHPARPAGRLHGPQHGRHPGGPAEHRLGDGGDAAGHRLHLPHAGRRGHHEHHAGLGEGEDQRDRA